MATREELADEAMRARKVQQIVDIAAALIMQSRMRRSEAEQLVTQMRGRILEFFPGSESTYEIVYSQRFRRLIDEFTVAEPGPQRLVFPSRQPRN
jgi:hypothetical protein